MSNRTDPDDQLVMKPTQCLKLEPNSDQNSSVTSDSQLTECSTQVDQSSQEQIDSVNQSTSNLMNFSTSLNTQSNQNSSPNQSINFSSNASQDLMESQINNSNDPSSQQQYNQQLNQKIITIFEPGQFSEQYDQNTSIKQQSPNQPNNNPNNQNIPNEPINDEIFDKNNRIIIYPLGRHENSDLSCYIFNICNQMLRQSISFCEIDQQYPPYKNKYFAKLNLLEKPSLIQDIISKILDPIIKHIEKYAKPEEDLDNIYDTTLTLIHQLNSIKIA